MTRTDVLSLLLPSLLLACTSGEPAGETRASAQPPASSGTTAAASSAPSHAASATVASGSASAATTPPAMPAVVTDCEATARQYGDFAPSVDEVVRADAALPSASCLARDVSEVAIRACAAKAGKTSLSVSTDKLGEAKSGCQVAVSGAAWQGRRFVVFFELRRDGVTFFGGARAVELTPDGAKLYLDALDAHAELCPTTATTGQLPKPEAMPAGWVSMPKELQAFLCGTD